MQSWADTGFGQLREAGLFPSRAAVLGIVAAARGLPRADPRLVELHEAFRVHVAQARLGQVFKDYHTVETEPGRPKTLTWRDYHHDAHFIAFLESHDANVVRAAVNALQNPIYTAYLGRRSCPPATPFLPIPIPDDKNGFEALVAETTVSRDQLPITGERRWGNPRTASPLDVYLDGHLSAGALPAPMQGLPVTYGTRRDRLVTPWRAYVNRPFTRVQVPPPQVGDHSDPQQAYFDAAP
jgi:CRISPR system Cascade subunit CasD